MRVDAAEGVDAAVINRGADESHGKKPAVHLFFFLSFPRNRIVVWGERKDRLGFQPVTSVEATGVGGHLAWREALHNSPLCACHKPKVLLFAQQMASARRAFGGAFASAGQVGA